MRTMKSLAVAAAVAFAAPAFAAPEKYEFDLGHSQVRFGYNHLGFSNVQQSFGKFDGTLMFDAADPTKSSVEVTIPLASVYTGVAKFDEHLKSADFFDVAKHADATFKSTKVTKAGGDKLTVAGDLTLNGVTKPVTLDVTINKVGQHPMAKKEAAGFDATTTLKRSDFNLGAYVPNVGDEVKVDITVEALKAEAK